ncbi:hypothetical protein F5X98DRAFT_379941 [Xylaria grammica]|nr:hypothetical protein F5X98DRAFT_379941 [Xylaria grammica]
MSIHRLRYEPTEDVKVTIVTFVINAVKASVTKAPFVDSSAANPVKMVAEHGIDSLLVAVSESATCYLLLRTSAYWIFTNTKTSINALTATIVNEALAWLSTISSSTIGQLWILMFPVPCKPYEIAKVV